MKPSGQLRRYKGLRRGRGPKRRPSRRVQAEPAQRAAWSAFPIGKQCVVCKTSRATDPHHITYEQHIRSRAKTLRVDPGPWLCDLRNCLPLCRACHASHHLRSPAIANRFIPAPARQFARELGLSWQLHIHYPEESA